MKPPIFVYEKNCYLDVFDTAEDAGLSLEAIDIEDNLYKAFDAEGRLLKIEPYNGIGKITEAEKEPTHQAELISYLKSDINHLRNRFVIDDNLDDNLNTLVSIIYGIEKGTIPRMKQPSIFSKFKNFLYKLKK